MKTILYSTNHFTKHYLIDLLEEPIEVTEEEFFKVVGMDREIVPMRYQEGNVNRQNFYLNDELIGYREK